MQINTKLISDDCILRQKCPFLLGVSPYILPHLILGLSLLLLNSLDSY